MSIRPIDPGLASMRTRTLPDTVQRTNATVSARLDLGARVVEELEDRGYGMSDLDVRDLMLSREVKVPVTTLARLLDVKLDDLLPALEDRGL